METHDQSFADLYSRKWPTKLGHNLDLLLAIVGVTWCKIDHNMLLSCIHWLLLKLALALQKTCFYQWRSWQILLFFPNLCRYPSSILRSMPDANHIAPCSPSCQYNSTSSTCPPRLPPFWSRSRATLKPYQSALSTSLPSEAGATSHYNLINLHSPPPSLLKPELCHAKVAHCHCQAKTSLSRRLLLPSLPLVWHRLSWVQSSDGRRWIWIWFWFRIQGFLSWIWTESL